MSKCLSALVRPFLLGFSRTHGAGLVKGVCSGMSKVPRPGKTPLDRSRRRTAWVFAVPAQWLGGLCKH